MKKYMLLSASMEGPIAGLFIRDHNMRTSRLSEGAKIGDTIITDIDSAADAFAHMLARRDFGKKARVLALKQDGICSTGVVFSAHIGGETPAGVYRGRDVRFAVTEKSNVNASTACSA
jgi:hypothetical protein